MCLYVYVYIYIYVYVMCIYIYIHRCVCVCLYVYIYMAYIYIYSPRGVEFRCFLILGFKVLKASECTGVGGLRRLQGP